MTAHRVRWTQQAIVTATVDVSLDELAAWAAEAGLLRALVDGAPGSADEGGVRAMLEHNRHLRDELLRRWAQAHLPRS
jgi:hypothetical protein